eukprot:GEMP01029528.1.p1 GENE.GEMP01029528.1~~GEMP01029528.1.p1  ORF type:complete len:224 (-),score=30.11 GEMP01029528.1:1179-1850(-)
MRRTQRFHQKKAMCLVPRNCIFITNSSSSMKPTKTRCCGLGTGWVSPMRRTQRYAIFPITFNSPGKKWVVSGLLGEPRTRQILFTAEDPSDNRYMPPQGPWLPDLGFVIKPACRNHVGDLTCMHLQPACKLGGQDVEWIQQCCRDTCDNCPVSRALCPLPKRRDPFGAPTAPPADPIAPPVQVFAVPTAAPAPAASSPPLATQPPSPPVALLRKTKTQAAIAT